MQWWNVLKWHIKQRKVNIMAQRTVFSCDNCADEIQAGAPFYEIIIRVEKIDKMCGPLSVRKNQWCSVCVEKAHLFPPVKSLIKVLPPVLTFEETLRKITQEKNSTLAGDT